MGKYILSTALFLVVAAIWILLWMLPANISWSKDGASGNCRDCHSGPKAKELKLEDIYEKITTLQYQHSVVEEEKCGQCHIVKGFKAGRRWEFTSPDTQREQIFFLKDLLWDRKYQIDLKIKDISGKEIAVAPFQFIPSQITTSMNNDQKAPLIKNVVVSEISQAVFLEATITWETDKPSNSIVEYGFTPQYGETTVAEKVFANGHKITMTGLKVGKQYHYRAISRDIFGNVGVSNDFLLDTTVQIKKDDGEKITDRMMPQVKEVSVFKINGAKDIFIKLLTDKTVKAYLVVNESAEIGKHGFGLAPASVSQIDACVKCHSEGASHPVRIRSNGPKTKIPSELPTIEGGMITCVTCHYPHGGNKKHFARLDFEKELCIKCHTGEPFI